MVFLLPLSNRQFDFQELVLRAPEELGVHIQHAQGSCWVHCSNSTVFKNIIFSTRNFIFSEPRGELRVLISGSDGAAALPETLNESLHISNYFTVSDRAVQLGTVSRLSAQG